jgi:hypothetical protein
MYRWDASCRTRRSSGRTPSRLHRVRHSWPSFQPSPIRAGPISRVRPSSHTCLHPRPCDAAWSVDGWTGPAAPARPPSTSGLPTYGQVEREMPISSATCAKGRPRAGPLDQQSSAVNDQPGLYGATRKTSSAVQSWTAPPHRRSCHDQAPTSVNNAPGQCT